MGRILSMNKISVETVKVRVEWRELSSITFDFRQFGCKSHVDHFNKTVNQNLIRNLFWTKANEAISAASRHHSFSACDFLSEDLACVTSEISFQLFFSSSTIWFHYYYYQLNRSQIRRRLNRRCERRHSATTVMTHGVHQCPITKMRRPCQWETS